MYRCPRHQLKCGIRTKQFYKVGPWMNPLKGARPVPGPIMMTGVWGRLGSRNCDLRTKQGTLVPGSIGLSQVVATPLLFLPVLVVYSTTTAVIWIRSLWTLRVEVVKRFFTLSQMLRTNKLWYKSFSPELPSFLLFHAQELFSKYWEWIFF
jgi:hypothetical protein